MSSVFNDFLHQTITASTIVAGACHFLPQIPQVPKIPEFEKVKHIALGIGAAATTIYAYRQKRLVLGIRIAAMASLAQDVYNLVPKSTVTAAVIRPPIIDLDTGIDAMAKTVQDAYNLVPSSTATATPPAAVIGSRIIELGTGIAATAKLAFGYVTNKKIEQLARVAAWLIMLHYAYNRIPKSTVIAPPPPPPIIPPAAVIGPRTTAGTRTGLYTERSTQEIANLALIAMLRRDQQAPAEIDQWIQQSAANVVPGAPVLGADIITHAAQIPTPKIVGTNTFDFRQALETTLAAVRSTGRAQGGQLRINGLVKTITIAQSHHAGHFVYRYFNPIASCHAPTAIIMEFGEAAPFMDFLNKQAQPFGPGNPPTTVCECIPCSIP